MGKRVLIDARAAIRPETGGVERWARELSNRLPAIEPDLYSVSAPPGLLAHRLGHGWEQTLLPAMAAASRADAVLCPANLAPLASRRNIVVIHDVAPIRFRSDFSSAYAGWQSFILPRIARRALAVVVPSEFSRSEVVEVLEVDPGRVHTVLGGVPEECSPDLDPRSVLSALGLTRPYVLTVASKVARKNLGSLAETSLRLATEGFDLVAVGGHRPQFDGSGRGGNGAIELGAVDEALLPSLYRGASAFVLPSLYEGFGLPVCEAMACGTPVVCSDRAALPEAAGGAALLVDPDDHAAIAEAVLRACAPGVEREGMISAGLKRVAGMSWQQTAVGVHRVCASVIDS